MNWLTGVVVYILVWWVTLFAILPLWVRPTEPGEQGFAAGARVLGDGEPQIGAHDKPVLFLHPKDFCGTLIELEQA